MPFATGWSKKNFDKKNFWSWCEFEILQNFWLSNFKDIYLVLVMEISKWIFLGQLFIYVGYGITKKKSEKLFESVIYSKKKKGDHFHFWFIDWNLMYAFLKLKFKKCLP
jgi:hypothetical protein